MKKYFVMMAVAMMMLTACEKNVDDIATSVNGQKEMIFSLNGDFGSAYFTYGGETTRGTLTADSKNMTDLWVFDYVGNDLVQQLHQVSTDDNFGTPTLTMSYGTHHVYFVASRGEEPTLHSDVHKISWTKPLDTFYKDLEITVTAGTSSNQNVTLDRCVTKLKITVDDEIPAGLATITITPGTWYYGIDYLTGGPTETKTSDARAYNIPSTYVGTTGDVNVNMYGFSGATQWTTDVTVVAKNGSGNVIGSASITGAPLVANRVTNYSGYLFNGNAAFSLGLNGDWANEYTGSW